MSEQESDARQPHILVVGGADTSRAPMAVALLRRMLEGRHLHWPVESAGVVGHDGDPAEPEARDAMTAFGLDISAHRARSLSAELVEAATLLLAIDSGTARVVRAQYPEVAARVVTIGALAGRQRDIPDPFRMQLGAWLGYVREIETLLRAGLERLIRMAQGESLDTAPPETQAASATPGAEEGGAAVYRPVEAGDPPLPINRSAPIERCERLLALMRDMPDLVEWPNARRQIEAEVRAASTVSLHPDDLVQSYATMLLATLGVSESAPAPAQIALLQGAIARLRAPIDHQAIAELSSEMLAWKSGA